MLKLLERLGGWPVLTENWDEANWSWEKSLLLLHRFAGVGEKTNIFRNGTSDGITEIEEAFDNILEGEIKADESSFDKYFEYMYEVAVLLGATADQKTKDELQDALELGVALNQLTKLKKFSKRSAVKRKEVEGLRVELELLNWMELFDKSKITFDDSTLVDFSVNVFDNWKRLKKIFPKRTFANYVLWRVIDFSVQFLDDAIQEKIFKLYRQTYGVLDKEQRWKLCTRMTNIYADLASGSLYIREHFPNVSRAAATDMANNIILEFRRTIKDSSWMDEATQDEALKVVDDLTVHMGYDERLLDTKHVEDYYGKQYKSFHDSFFYLAVQLAVFKADKAFKHKYRSDPDWTEFAKPTTNRARYNKNDNSVCKLILVD